MKKVEIAERSRVQGESIDLKAGESIQCGGMSRI